MSESPEVCSGGHPWWCENCEGWHDCAEDCPQQSSFTSENGAPEIRTDLVATPDPGTYDTGEEMERTADCLNCGGALFEDFIEVDDDRWRIHDDTCFWQHNDERYTPGKPSPCGPPEKWEALATP